MAKLQDQSVDLTPLTVPVSVFRQVMGGIGQTKAYDLIDDGEVETIKVGTRRLVVYQSILDYIGRQMQAQATLQRVLSGRGWPRRARKRLSDGAPRLTSRNAIENGSSVAASASASGRRCDR
jgi:hypothetical protein